MRRWCVAVLAVFGSLLGGSPDAVAQASYEVSALASVSCPTDNFCMAVGYRSTAPLTASGLAYRWDGTSWHAVATPPPPAGKTVLGMSSVSCTSTVFCLATGYAGDGRTAASLIVAERWNGRSWRTIAIQRPGRTSAADVACVGASTCVAVGSHQVTRNGQDLTQAVAWQYTGGALRLRDTAARPFPETALSSVSCFAADNCTAVGVERKIGRPLAEHWNGKRWTWVGALPEPARAADESGVALSGVSCPAPRSCVAVGGDPRTSAPVVENRKAGGAWFSAAPSLGNVDIDGASSFTHVSCVQYQRCAAVGALYDRYNTFGILGWRDFRTGHFVVTRSDAVFRDVTCRDNACVYVGYGTDPGTGAMYATIYRGRANPTQQTIPAASS